MNRVLMVGVLWVASGLGADGATIFFRDFSSFVPVNQDVITPGEDLAFRITADSGATFDWLWEIPPTTITTSIMPPYQDSITEVNAVAKGIDWSALVLALEGDRGQGTEFGPVGFELATPYLVEPNGYIDDVTLTEVRVQLNKSSATRWSTASITLAGIYTGLAPEPSSLLVLLTGVAHIMLVHSRRRAGTSHRS